MLRIQLLIHLVCRHKSLFVCLLRFHVNIVTSVCLAPIWHKMSHGASNLCVEHFMSGLQFGYTKTMRELWLVTSCERQRELGRGYSICRAFKTISWRQYLKSYYLYFVCIYVFIFNVLVSFFVGAARQVK